MAVSVTGPRAVNELGGPVIPGNLGYTYLKFLGPVSVALSYFNKDTIFYVYIRLPALCEVTPPLIP